jgi:hypothetical protein
MGAERYWEGRWRTEKAENEKLRTALEYLIAECAPDMDEDYNPHARPLAQARAALEPTPGKKTG